MKGDVFQGVRNFYLTNAQPGNLADNTVPPNGFGFRIAIGTRDIEPGVYGISVSGRLNDALGIVGRDELIKIRDAITAELQRGQN